MAKDELDTRLTERRPVVAGLLALVGVGVVVGVIAGLAVFVGTRMLGVGEGSATAEPTARESMYLPRPEKTTPVDDPLITFAPGRRNGNGPSAEPLEGASDASPKKQISLSSGTTEAGPMEQVDLTGVYPEGEGAILRVQRFEAGAWADFPVTASVSNETFSTYVQTSQRGVNRFRVVDTDSGLTSNDVRVTIG